MTHRQEEFLVDLACLILWPALLLAMVLGISYVETKDIERRVQQYEARQR